MIYTINENFIKKINTRILFLKDVMINIMKWYLYLCLCLEDSVINFQIYISLYLVTFLIFANIKHFSININFRTIIKIRFFKCLEKKKLFLLAFLISSKLYLNIGYIFDHYLISLFIHVILIIFFKYNNLGGKSISDEEFGQI